MTWRGWLRATATVVALALIALLPARAGATFALGLQEDGVLQKLVGVGANAAEYSALHQLHGNWVRIVLPWALIGSEWKTAPTLAAAGNPADPHYVVWQNFDGDIKTAALHHAHVILNVAGAPTWAQGSGRPSCEACTGSWNVDPSQLGAFMHAAAERYSGHFPDPTAPGTYLPHVSDWEIWNEENLPESLIAPDVVSNYRNMLNASYSAIKSVDPRAVVAIGGLAPVSFVTGGIEPSVSPLRFIAELFCLHRLGTRFLRNPACPAQAQFDVLAMHPYTLAATPTKHAYKYDDVLTGDIGKLRAIIAAAERLRTVGGSYRHGLWVTEWEWMTNPPNQCVGDRGMTAARYVAWSMYEMWRAGVSIVIWLGVRDLPGTETCADQNPSFINGGALYDANGTVKPVLRAFAFPFAAGVTSGRGFAWGRAPVSRGSLIVVQRRSGHRWVLVGRTRTASDGTFYIRFRARGNGTYRAAVEHGPISFPYNSKPIPPRRTHAFYSG